MNFETFLNAFDFTTDEEQCASLTPSFCPEIIALLNSPPQGARKTFSMFSGRDYGFDEHVQGLC